MYIHWVTFEIMFTSPHIAWRASIGFTRDFKYWHKLIWLNYLSFWSFYYQCNKSHMCETEARFSCYYTIFLSVISIGRFFIFYIFWCKNSSGSWWSSRSPILSLNVIRILSRLNHFSISRVVLISNFNLWHCQLHAINIEYNWTIITKL